MPGFVTDDILSCQLIVINRKLSRETFLECHVTDVIKHNKYDIPDELVKLLFDHIVIDS